MQSKSFFHSVKKIKAPVILSVFTLIFLIFFFCFMAKPAFAGSGSYTEVKGYETFLVKKGDTLSSIAAANAGRLSQTTNHEYMESIMIFNNLESEHIQAGQYILLPNYV